jgi:N-acetylmuramoyl-L-alanine amidase
MRHDPTYRTIRALPLVLFCVLLVYLCCPPALSFGKQPGPSLSRTSQKQSVKTAMIANLRYYGSPDQRRLIFDVGRPLTYTQQRVSNPDQLVINLANTVLSRTAKRKLDAHALPKEIEVKQAGARRVQVTVNMENVSGLKLQALHKPNRLVLEYEYAPKRSAPPIVQPKVTAPIAPPKIMTPIVRPKITLPPLTRQSTESQRQARLDIDTIVLDPGHGGKDPGAIGRAGLTEKEVVLDVALRLRELIQDRLGKKVLMTRTTDAFIELDDRAKFANAQKAELFVSIHINSHPSLNVRGIEMYHFGIASDHRARQVAARENGETIDHAHDFLDLIKADLALSKRIEESQNLAWETKLAIVNLVGGAYDLEDHGVKTAPFYVLRYTAMPSILAELSFISNSADEKLLRTSSYRQKMAEALFEGIRNYLNSVQVAFAR